MKKLEDYIYSDDRDVFYNQYNCQFCVKYFYKSHIVSLVGFRKTWIGADTLGTNNLKNKRYRGIFHESKEIWSWNNKEKCFEKIDVSYDDVIKYMDKLFNIK